MRFKEIQKMIKKSYKLIIEFIDVDFEIPEPQFSPFDESGLSYNSELNCIEYSHEIDPEIDFQDVYNVACKLRGKEPAELTLIQGFCFAVLHEIGHYSRFHTLTDEYRRVLSDLYQLDVDLLDVLYVDDDDANIAYRLINEEYDADSFALFWFTRMIHSGVI